jgi:hypothetical protein
MAAAVQKVRLVMQWWPVQLPSPFCTPTILSRTVAGNQVCPVVAPLLQHRLGDQVEREILLASGLAEGGVVLGHELSGLR